MTQPPMAARVLIIEDDQWLAQHYLRILSREGYDAVTTDKAEQAIDLIDDIKPQAILLDVLLTGTTALALLHELQSHEDLAQIPIILATNLGDHVAVDDVASYGVKKILDKSVMRPEDVTAAIRGVLL